MTENEANSESAIPPSKKTCFVISAFGSTPDEQRGYKQVLRHLIQKVLESRYVVVRADQIDDEGLITNQIIEHLLEDDLVVADLTGLNPNVFYEVAVRHAARKPIVHLITKGQDIPFDVANMRAVPYALDDPDVLEEARAELTRKVSAIEASDWKAAPNPITAARDVWLLRDSEQPEIREAGDLLAGFNDLRDEVRSLARRVGSYEIPDAWSAGVPRLVQDHVLAEVKRSDPIAEETLAAKLGLAPDRLRSVLAALHGRNEAFPVDGKWSTIPF